METFKDDKEKQTIFVLTCILKIFRVYCNDFGGSDITDSMEISNDIGNTLLSAYVWKYSGFINSITIDKKNRFIIPSRKDIY